MMEYHILEEYENFDEILSKVYKVMKNPKKSLKLKTVRNFHICKKNLQYLKHPHWILPYLEDRINVIIPG
ncbi:hypothetical protein Glove_276g14 [Diversispora epigaea]|uniref:Uncharacterized protein n=1 Tax=Diversispora epigaea TaxID=1348612 RepID=A0A397I9X6_9GLOM|nr:hypothetical protein Glove_276g14 [Diversispora epigaea]